MVGLRQAVILVGGRGTRLGALAANTPKPLLPIAGEICFLDTLIENIARHGFIDIILLAGHLGDAVETRYAGANLRGARIRVIREAQPLGTGGALLGAKAYLDDVFLMTNGDSALDINYLALGAMLGRGDMGALALRTVEDAGRFGRVDLSGSLVTGFHEKDPSHTGPALVSGGVYVLRKAVIDLVTTTPCSIETEVFPELARRGRLAAHVTGDAYFLDIGLPETLDQAFKDGPRLIHRGAAFFDRDGTLNHDEGYTFRLEDLVWRTGAIDAIRACNDAGLFVFVVTKQSGTARGRFTEADMHAFHARMQAELAAAGAHVDAFYFSPFHADSDIGHLAVANHPDRKPNPGMLRRACVEWSVDAARSFMMGDSDADEGAARAMGLAFRKVGEGEVLPAVQELLAGAPRTTVWRDRGDLLQSAAERAHAWLFDHAFPVWWEKGFDQDLELFHERLNFDLTAAALPRRVRVQARQTYVYALAGDMGWQGPWREAVEAGSKALVEHCLHEDGGTRHLLDVDGRPLDERRDLYDAAFVIFALSHAGRLLQRPDLIAQAERLVGWLEGAWSHPQGGFLEGEITPCPPRRQNPHMHMFEAFLALHQASGKAEHLERASRIAGLFGTRLFDRKSGALPEYFDDSWSPLPGEDGRICEPGHQFEWSWLLHRWCDASGGDLRAEAERLRVHGEIYGVDGDGFTIDETYLDGSPRACTSRLWPHTERIKANCARFERTRDMQAAAACVAAFEALMSYTKGAPPGLWRDRRRADGSFVDEPAPASSFYHAALALSELIRVAG